MAYRCNRQGGITPEVETLIGSQANYEIKLLYRYFYKELISYKKKYSTLNKINKKYEFAIVYKIGITAGLTERWQHCLAPHGEYSKAGKVTRQSSRRSYAPDRQSVKRDKQRNS